MAGSLLPGNDSAEGAGAASEPWTSKSGPRNRSGPQPVPANRTDAPAWIFVLRFMGILRWGRAASRETPGSAFSAGPGESDHP